MKHCVKRLVAAIVAGGAIAVASAQPVPVSMELVQEFPVGVGPEMIQFSRGPYLGGSPAILTFAAGDQLWIGEVSDAKIFHIHDKRIFNTVPYPMGKGSRRIAATFFLTFLEDALFVDNVTILRYNVTRNPLLVGPPSDYMQPTANSRLFAIRDYVFFYDSNKSVRAIDNRGNMLSKGATVALLQQWLTKTWYPDESSREVHANLVDSGMYIIVDRLFYPFTGAHMLEYFQVIGATIDSDLQQELRGGDFSLAPDGVAMCGDIYFPSTAGEYVVSQKGEILAVIKSSAVYPRYSDRLYSTPSGRNDVSGLLQAVHWNGDLYTLYAIKDSVARIHKAVKTWGNDLISMARQGVESGGELSTQRRIEEFSNAELRLLRNALFALHGYAFISWDLSCYFGGFDWYTPDLKVRSDSNILTADQKRLFELVATVEKQRTIAP